MSRTYTVIHMVTIFKLFCTKSLWALLVRKVVLQILFCIKIFYYNIIWDIDVKVKYGNVINAKVMMLFIIFVIIVQMNFVSLIDKKPNT